MLIDLAFRRKSGALRQVGFASVLPLAALAACRSPAPRGPSPPSDSSTAQAAKSSLVYVITGSLRPEELGELSTTESQQPLEEIPYAAIDLRPHWLRATERRTHVKFLPSSSPRAGIWWQDAELALEVPLRSDGDEGERAVVGDPTHRRATVRAGVVVDANGALAIRLASCHETCIAIAGVEHSALSESGGAEKTSMSCLSECLGPGATARPGESRKADRDTQTLSERPQFVYSRSEVGRTSELGLRASAASATELCGIVSKAEPVLELAAETQSACIGPDTECGQAGRVDCNITEALEGSGILGVLVDTGYPTYRGPRRTLWDGQYGDYSAVVVTGNRLHATDRLASSGPWNCALDSSAEVLSYTWMLGALGESSEHGFVIAVNETCDEDMLYTVKSESTMAACEVQGTDPRCRATC